MSSKITIIFVITMQTEILCSAISPEQFLLKYGYVSAIPRTKEGLTEGIKLYQTLFGLQVTGEINEETRQRMARPRCGNTDPIDTVKNRIPDEIRDDKGRGYNLYGSKWINNKLTYRIKEGDYGADSYWSKKLDQNSTLRLIRFAYDIWSAVTPLQFIYIDEPKRKTHLRFQYSVWVHCCHPNSVPWDVKFDRNGGTQAHAESPAQGGDIHIDDDEDYLSFNDDRRDTKMKYILIHEIGHSLGLEHVFIDDSVMFPEYKDPKSNSFLNKGDINGIRALYGNESMKSDEEYRLLIP